MTARNNHLLLARLYQDLLELKSQPYPGVAVFTDDANLRSFCLVLTPPSGPWEGLSLHFDVTLPANWPAAPPSISSSAPRIDHPNLFGSYICCDLLKPTEYLPTGYTGGYSPALTLRGLFLQFLTFFSSTKVEQDVGYVIDIGDRIKSVYLWEENVAALLIQDPNSRAPPNQIEQERIWKNSTGKETLLTAYSSLKPTVPLTHHHVKYIASHGKDMHRVSSTNRRWTTTLEEISKWTCTKCPYGTDQLPHNTLSLSQELLVSEQELLYQVPEVCQIGNLNDDTLAELTSHLSSEGVISLSTAWPRFKDFTGTYNVLLHRELRCFFLRTSMLGSNVVMGVGVALGGSPLSFTSDFDWLSQDAFSNFGVRKSIEKRDFDFFLPLAFSPEHFKRAEDNLWLSLTSMETEYRKRRANIQRKQPRQNGRQRAAAAPQPTPALKPLDVATVLFRMMNSIVVSLMKSCDEEHRVPSVSHRQPERHGRLLHASERALTSYTHLLHTLLSLARSGQRGAALLVGATTHLRNFVVHPEARHKTQTPDLGDFIASLLMVRALPCVDDKAAVTWERVCPTFVEEATVRNVRWVLQKYPYLENVEGEGQDGQPGTRWAGADDARLGMTFDASRTSLRLVMFQVAFMELFVEGYGMENGLARLDSAYGFVDASLPERMVSEIHEIYRVKSWAEYFARIKFQKGHALGKTRFAQILRDSVNDSARKQYHTPSRAGVLTDYRGKKGELIATYMRNRK